MLNGIEIRLLIFMVFMLCLIFIILLVILWFSIRFFGVVVWLCIMCWLEL